MNVVCYVICVSSSIYLSLYLSIYVTVMYILLSILISLALYDTFNHTCLRNETDGRYNDVRVCVCSIRQQE